MALLNAPPGGEVSVTVPDGEVWEVLCLSGAFGGDPATDYMLITVSNGTLTAIVFTFNATATGNNSYTVNCNIVLDAGHTLTVAASDTATFAYMVASGRAWTIY